MSGRGRGLLSANVNQLFKTSGQGKGLQSEIDVFRRPTNADENCHASIDELVSRIIAVTSPDDLEVQILAKEIISTINNEDSLSDLVNKLYENGLDHRETAPVIAAVCGQAAQHQVGKMKLRNLLLHKLQASYKNREELEATDRMRFVTSSLFLGEIYHRCKNTNGSPIQVLATPIVEYLLVILRPHLSLNPGVDINEEMMVIAKELLQSGRTLFKSEADGLADVVSGVTEVLVRHRSHLSDACQLNLLAALADLWPDVNSVQSPRTTHATLAAKLGLSLNI